MARKDVQYFNAMLDSNNEVKINDFYPYFINYEPANPSYNKVLFNRKYNVRVGDSYTENVTEKSEDMVFAMRKRLGFEKTFFFDADDNDITHIFDKPKINCETGELIPVEEITDRLDQGAHVTDHERLEGELFLMVRGGEGFKRYIFKLTNYSATNLCGELINPTPCIGKFVLRGVNDCEGSEGIYPDDPCINDKFTKFTGPRGQRSGSYKGKVLYVNEDGVQGWYIPCKSFLQSGDVVYLNSVSSNGGLSGQRTISRSGSQFSYNNQAYCEVSELLGGFTSEETGFLDGTYQFEVYPSIGESLAFATGNGLEYITYGGSESGEMETIKDSTFYDQTCPISNSNKRRKITGISQTPWGGLSIKHTSSPYVIYGVDGAQGQSYFLNTTYVGREYSEMHNVYDHIILLGKTQIGTLSPSYDLNNNFTGAKHVIIEDNVGYYSRDSFDVGLGYLTIYTNHKYFMRVKFSAGYSSQLQYEYSRFFMYDDIVSNIKEPDRVYLHDNGGNTIVSVVSYNRTMMFHYDQKHNFRYMWIIKDAEVFGVKNNVWYGNGVFCRTCEKKDVGEYFDTLIRAKHGHRALFSLSELIKMKLIFGEASWIEKGKNVLSLHLEAGGEQRERHTDQFYNTERGGRLMKVKTRDVEETDLFIKEDTGRCINIGNTHRENCGDYQSSFDFMQSFLCDKPDIDECTQYEDSSSLGGIGMIEFPISKMYNFMSRELRTEGKAEFEFYGAERSYHYPSTEMTKLTNVIGTKSDLICDTFRSGIK